MTKQVLVFGNGFIAKRIQGELGFPISDKKIFTFSDAEDQINKFHPKLIVNCVGHIGTNVDDCELKKDKTLTANTFVPIILSEVAFRHKIKLVHISTGCIYHFDYSCDELIGEDRIPDFFELFYSRTKIYAEQVLLTLGKKHPILIVRIRIPLDNRPHPRNLLTKLLKYERIIDMPNSVTYIPDFIGALKYLIDIDAEGLYNVVNKGALRNPELLDIYKNYVPNFEYKVIKSEKSNLVRTNLMLSTEKLNKTGFKVRDIHEVLDGCVREYLSAEGANLVPRLNKSAHILHK